MMHFKCLTNSSQPFIFMEYFSSINFFEQYDIELFLAITKFGTYSQLLPCGHPAISDTPIIRTAAKSPAKTNYSQLSPCRHSAIMDTPIIWTASWIPGKNKLQRFDRNKLPLLRTLANVDLTRVDCSNNQNHNNLKLKRKKPFQTPSTLNWTPLCKRGIKYPVVLNSNIINLLLFPSLRKFASSSLFLEHTLWTGYKSYRNIPVSHRINASPYL